MTGTERFYRDRILVVGESPFPIWKARRPKIAQICSNCRRLPLIPGQTMLLPDWHYRGGESEFLLWGKEREDATPGGSFHDGHLLNGIPQLLLPEKREREILSLLAWMSIPKAPSTWEGSKGERIFFVGWAFTPLSEKDHHFFVERAYRAC